MLGTSRCSVLGMSSNARPISLILLLSTSAEGLALHAFCHLTYFNYVLLQESAATFQFIENKTILSRKGNSLACAVQLQTFPASVISFIFLSKALSAVLLFLPIAPTQSRPKCCDWRCSRISGNMLPFCRIAEQVCI